MTMERGCGNDMIFKTVKVKERMFILLSISAPNKLNLFKSSPF
jgi:hypothetical protein